MGIYRRGEVNQSARINKLEDEKIKSVSSGSENKISNIVSMTQADYDALPIKETDKLYIIVG